MPIFTIKPITQYTCKNSDKTNEIFRNVDSKFKNKIYLSVRRVIGTSKFSFNVQVKFQKLVSMNYTNYSLIRK